VVIVPVNDTETDLPAIRKALEDIYAPVGIHWEVSEEKGYFYTGANKFFEQGSGILHEYTPEMRAMNADFAGKYEVDSRANYLFVLQYSGRTMSRDAAGFMPRGSQFGYIFTKDFGSDKEILQTIAHELGHGRLLLKHTFDKDYKLPQAGTDNLMDYTPLATHLAKWQWDLASDPGIAQGVFDKDEDGMMLPGILQIFDPNYKIAADLLVDYLKSLGAKPIVTESEKSIRVESVLSYAAIVLNIDYTFEEDGDMIKYGQFLYNMGIEFYDATLVHESGVWDKLVWKIKKWDNQSKRYLQKPPKAVVYMVDMIMDYPMGIGPGAWIKLYNGEHFITGKTYSEKDFLRSGFTSLIGGKIGNGGLSGELVATGINIIRDNISDFYADLQEVNNMPSSVKSLVKYDLPKIFLQKYQDFFHKAGIDFKRIIISIDAVKFLETENKSKYIMETEESWDEFIRSHSNASIQDILSFVNMLIKDKHEGIIIYYSNE
jgi:hypothetical protein